MGQRPVRSFVLPSCVLAFTPPNPRSEPRKARRKPQHKCPVPPGQGNGPPLPCRGVRSGSSASSGETARFLLERRSQSAAFESPGNQARHRGTTPAATLLPGLVMVYVSEQPFDVERSFQSVTSLGSHPDQLRTSQAPARAQFPPRPLRSTGQGQERGGQEISAGRRQKHPLTHRKLTLRISVTSPIELTGSPFRAL